MIKTLQKRFIITAMIAVTVLIIIMLGILNVANALISSNQTEQLMDNLIEAHFPPMMGTPPPPNMQGGIFVPTPSENSKIEAAFFIAHTNKSGEVILVDVSRIASVTEDEGKEIVEKAILSGKSEGKIDSLKYRSAPFGFDGGEMYIFLDTTSQMLSVLRIGMLSLLVGVFGWVLMLLLVIFLSKKAIRPIAANMERQKQFVTDAGHEIKTPLAIIMANTDAMELQGGETKYSRNIREQTVRLSGLMQNLLTLSKLDEGQSVTGKDRVCISDMVQESGKMFAEALELKNIRYEESITPELYVSVNRDMYARLLSILFDNAVKYCPDAGVVKVSLRGNEKGIVLEFYNDCDKLPECAPDKLFDRFYRADPARTQKGGGYGIGLSAARTIVEAHGDSINASYIGNAGILFTVKIS